MNRKNNLFIIITYCIGLNWLPSIIFGVESKYNNLFSILAIILILLTFFQSSFKFHMNSKIFSYIIFSNILIIAGILGGVIVGSIPFSYFYSFFVNFIITLYYANFINMETKKNIIISLIVCSWIISIFVILSYMGLLPTLQEVSVYFGYGIFLERKWAGVGSSLLGSYIALLINSLVGVINIKKLNLIYYIFSLSVVIIVSAITAQRSLILIFVCSVLIIFIKYFIFDKRDLNKKIKSIISIILFGSASLIIFMFVRNHLLFYSLIYRLSIIKEDINYYYRKEMWKVFLNKLIRNPTLFAKGDLSDFEKIGGVPHMILGESYYYGGILALIGLLIMLIVSLRILIKQVTYQNRKKENYNYYWFLLSSFVSILVYLTIMPGFFSRIPFILIGLSLSSANSNKSNYSHDKTI